MSLCRILAVGNLTSPPPGWLTPPQQWPGSFQNSDLHTRHSYLPERQGFHSGPQTSPRPAPSLHMSAPQPPLNLLKDSSAGLQKRPNRNIADMRRVFFCEVHQLKRQPPHKMVSISGSIQARAPAQEKWPGPVPKRPGPRGLPARPCGRHSPFPGLGFHLENVCIKTHLVVLL